MHDLDEGAAMHGDKWLLSAIWAHESQQTTTQDKGHEGTAMPAVLATSSSNQQAVTSAFALNAAETRLVYVPAAFLS